MAKPQILLAEENLDSLAIGRYLLLSAGYEVYTADGPEALELLKSQPFDLVVTDLTLPRLGGLSLIEQVRGNPQTAQLPLIAITDYKGAIVTMARQAGATEVINRQEDLLNLAEIVKQVLDSASNNPRPAQPDDSLRDNHS